MALLKPEFLREHPIQSGMIWTAGYVPLFLLLGWVTGTFNITSRFVLVVIALGVLGGIAWGYWMKAYHDRAASR
jgi:hypothetical protein